ncbi:2-C-methyl-D-erythritol 4-phosphate cytidylyltransferase [Parachlamydia sp. AcF125]|uniref:2-C-methyl-D-erythritol 4-phosphate cytidylyltransferase n=1 Tax=Parachlamydia sp. AcF125 TaxID=2795736 RepID=UPI001BCA2FAF|nr:2-C-methyl-D-erythritol 4-phosphate cytidylyltransferase [Parachlamydia sp. AcF125]MBS4167900.1 2-C-methyl-D-erythritol 4-phosphate cytidylyltransferase [Parachlamydia sp. AcF125]
MRELASVILLAGGRGSRMRQAMPKQFLPLAGKPLVFFSLECFMALPEILEIVVVCDPVYHSLFANYMRDPRLRFALPGPRRQDSVWNGLQTIKQPPQIVCIHDAARPCIDQLLVKRVLKAAREHGAATAGMPLKFTLKQSTAAGFVDKTLDRSLLWEIQTPQAIDFCLLHQGFKKVHELNREVTDDVSMVELLEKPVKLVEGDYANLKITTPEDLIVAEQWLAKKSAENSQAGGCGL